MLDLGNHYILNSLKIIKTSVHFKCTYDKQLYTRHDLISEIRRTTRLNTKTMKY